MSETDKSETEIILHTIIDAVYVTPGRNMPFTHGLRPTLDRYKKLNEAGFKGEAIMIVDNLLSCAEQERILPGGEYPSDVRKSREDIHNDFCRSLRTKISGNLHIFRAKTPALEATVGSP
ncbi:MAG: hypothetical protein WBK55_09830 [Alphaproteobacteria bacterium]